MLGGDEFLQGLGIGLKSFLGGTVGKILCKDINWTGIILDHVNNIRWNSRCWSKSDWCSW